MSSSFIQENKVEFNTVTIALLALAGAALLLNFVFNAKFEKAEVLEVLDGDSLLISTEKNKKGIKLRLAGIDCPEESSSVFHRDEKFAREAARYVEKRLPPRTKIFLEYDRQKWDEFGRLLAYVYLGKTGKSLNAELLNKGLAFYKAHRRNRKHEVLFKKLEAHAQKHRLGLWAYYGKK